jgi:hypothetical protein
VEEKQRRLKNDILAFARRYFSPHEVEMLAHIVDPELRRQEFIKLWTLKVCYIIEFRCAIGLIFTTQLGLRVGLETNLTLFCQKHKCDSLNY